MKPLFKNWTREKFPRNRDGSLITSLVNLQTIATIMVMTGFIPVVMTE